MHLDNKIEKENNQKGDFTMNKAQERVEENRSLMEVYTYVLNQIRKEENWYTECLEELYEIDRFGEFTPGRDRNVVFREKIQHEAAVKTLYGVKEKLEKKLKNKA